MTSKRMTANPAIPARHRPGKPKVEDSSSDYSDNSETEHVPAAIPPTAPPKAASFPKETSSIVRKSRGVEADSKDRSQLDIDSVARLAEDEGFITEESSEEGDSQTQSDVETESESEDSSSEEEAPRKLLRPTFIKKDSRKEAPQQAAAAVATISEVHENAQRNEKANAMVEEQLEKVAIAKEAGRREWDDDEIEESVQVDDTDDLDPETERAAWKLRELKRVKREREAIELAEKEREEIERRRNLSKDEREAEDQEFLSAQKEAKEGKGKMSYMQKYFHKGAFFQDDEAAQTITDRDIMGSRIADDVGNRELLPQFMQVRDMSKLGKKGRTRYKDLKTEDTGRWGQDSKRGPGSDRMDERFLSDRERERTGANATSLGTNRRTTKDAPTGPRYGEDGSQSGSRNPHFQKQSKEDISGRQSPLRSASPRGQPGPLGRSPIRKEEWQQNGRKRSPSIPDDTHQHGKRPKYAQLSHGGV